jgi:two-component system chemotaxis sensor kinase CheA
MMDELLKQFIIEARELTALAQADLSAQAKNAEEADIGRLFRTIHTLKGSVAIFDMAPAERALHVGEDLLGQVRSGQRTLSPSDREALIALVDQTDRWVDAVERAGSIGRNAPRESDIIVERLQAAQGHERDRQASSWLDEIKVRESDVISKAPGDLTAFRYSPDTQCFFRGDDPIATTSRIPDLVSLAVMPASDWPELSSFEPFECTLVIEGLSRASVADVRQAFRMVSDQVDVQTVAGSGEQIDLPSSTASISRSLRVDLARIDALADGVGELIIAGNSLAHVASEVGLLDTRAGVLVSHIHERVERAVSDMREAVMAVRMTPLGPTLHRLPRLVREISEQLNKPVAFEIHGELIEIDKGIADQLFEPLLHIIRNSLDHGIESAELRRAAGKPEAGSLSLEVLRDGDQIVVSVSDDGAGIDIARVRDTAVSRGLLTREAAGLLDDGQVMRLILVAGFSTSADITTLSGRGVGMDAVRSVTEYLGGRVEIDSRPGRGTTIAMRLPLNAIMTRLLIVRAGAERYGVPLHRIVETASLSSDRILPVGTGRACVLRDRTLPVLSLHDLLGIESTPSSFTRLLVTETDTEQVALIVDNFEERIDAVVRPRSGLLARLQGVAGTVLLGSGEIVLVLDLQGLIA